MTAAVLIIIGLVITALAAVAAIADRKPDTRRYPERPSTTVRIIPGVYDWQKAGER